MTDPSYIRGQHLPCPSFASQDEFQAGRQLGGSQKKFPPPPLAIRQSIPHEQEVASEIPVGRHRMMGFGIESVVNGIAVPSTETKIVSNDRIATAIGEDEVISRNQRAKRIGKV